MKGSGKKKRTKIKEINTSPPNPLLEEEGEFNEMDS
jgi:hypothetical protein